MSPPGLASRSCGSSRRGSQSLPVCFAARIRDEHVPCALSLVECAGGDLPGNENNGAPCPSRARWPCWLPWFECCRHACIVPSLILILILILMPDMNPILILRHQCPRGRPATCCGSCSKLNVPAPKKTASKPIVAAALRPALAAERSPEPNIQSGIQAFTAARAAVGSPGSNNVTKRCLLPRRTIIIEE